MIIRRFAAIALCAVVLNSCANDDSTGPLPAQNVGWERTNFVGAFLPPDASTGFVAIATFGGGVSAIDAATGATRWSLQLPAPLSQSYFARWVSPRDIIAFNPFPDASPGLTLIDGASGTVRRSGSSLIQPLAILNSWAIASAADTALLGLTSLADSVIWRRTYPRISCGRASTCRLFDPIGVIGNTLYIKQSVVTGQASARVDSLLRIEATGQTSARVLPFVSEPLTRGSEPRVSSAESLYWMASETSVYGVNVFDGTIRWRVLTPALFPPRNGVAIDFLHADEDSSERTLRVAFYLQDTVKNARSIEGVVLRMSDGSVVRGITLDATKRAQLAYVGPCGSDGVAFVNSEGTIDYARWSGAPATHWRSSKLNDAMPPYLQQNIVPYFYSAGTTTLLVELGLTNTLLGLNCAH